MLYVNRDPDNKVLKRPPAGKLRFRNAPFFFVLMIGLVIFLAAGIMFSMTKQRTLLLGQNTVHMRHERALLAEVVKEALLREDYVSATRLLNLFVSDHTNIVSIRAVTSEGVVLSGGRQSVPEGAGKVSTRRISYGEGRYVDLELREDPGPLLQIVDQITKQYIFWSVAFAILMGMGLWHAFRKMLLRPMELTMEETSRENAALEQSVKERTVEWMKANTELQMEIQERLAVEKLISESEKKYKHLVELTTDFIYICDNQGTLVYMNDASFRILGYAPGEVIGRSLASVVHPDDWEMSSGKLREMMEQHADVFNFENRYLAKDGTVIHLLHNIRLLWNEDGSIMGVQGIAKDITKRRQAEEAIRRNYEFQAALNELLSIPIEDLSLQDVLQQVLDFIVSISWLSIEAKGSIHLVGDEPGVLLLTASKGIPVDLIRACERLPFGRCICGRAAETRELQYASGIDERHDISYTGMDPHGHYCVPVISAGRVLGVMNLYLREWHQRDDRECDFLTAFANILAGMIQRKRVQEEKSILIDELQEAFEDVTRSQKEWRETFDSITDLIYITDVDHVIVRANRAMAEYFGLTPREVIGRKCSDLFHESGGDYMACPHALSLQQQTKVQGEYVEHRKKKTFLMTAFPYFSQDGRIQGSIVSSKDITGEKEREMRLIMSERLASLGQMASGIAHEINNPLAAIAGCTEGLMRRVKQERYDAAVFTNYLNIIEEEIVRCKDITSSMLSFVRKTTYDQRDIDINLILEKTLEIIGFQGRLQQIEVVRNYAKDLPRIKGSEGELRQVFLAIITNALDAMDSEGRLTLETMTEGSGISIRIADSGAGISSEHITRVFDPFFTTKGEKDGTGLGLFIANKIITNHRGTITVSSEAGKGTIFTIALPV